MMNSPEHARRMERLRSQQLDILERERQAGERTMNFIRIVSYNNRRIRIGLRPLEIPAALHPLAPGRNWYPVNRDNLELDKR